MYCCTCILALFLPSAVAFGVLAGIVAAILCVASSSRVTLALCLGLVVSCAHFYRYESNRIPTACFDAPIKASGVITSFPKSHEGVGGSSYLSFDLDVRQSLPTECGSGGKFRAYANSDEEAPAIKIGDSVTGDLRLRPLGSLWNRGKLPSNVHALANKTSALATVTDITAIEQQGSSLSALRYRLSQSISQYAKQAGAERLLQGLLLGRQDALDPKDWLFLREFGIVHVLVVSGVHVSLVMLWMQSLLALPRRFFVFRHDAGPGWVNLTAVSLLACGYVLITGASLPAQRALLMMCVTQSMRVLLWRVSPLSSVLASASLLITINPWSALTSGFWLSVLLTAIIIIETERQAENGPGNRILGWFRLTCVLTLISSALSIFFFHQFSVGAFISNLLIAPIFTAVLLPVGLFGLVMTEFHREAGGWLLGITADIVSELMGLMAAGAMSHLGQLKSIFLQEGVLLFVAVVILTTSLPKKLATTAVLVLPLSLSGSSHHSHTMEVVVADVGQGTLILVSKGDYSLLYDTGGVGGSGTSIAEREVIPWLKSRGVEEIDLLVVSHGDLDHSGGLSAVREYFDITQHWGFEGTPCVAGRELSPSPGFIVSVMMGRGTSASNTNADSCVVLVEFHKQWLLLAGDIPSMAEFELIAGGFLPHKIDILIAAHHGSGTSSSQTFIDKAGPTHTVFTTKRGNRFNHPDSAVLQRFRTAGTVLWDTAYNGAVTFKLTPSGGLSVRGMRSAFSPYWAQF